MAASRTLALLLSPLVLLLVPAAAAAVPAAVFDVTSFGARRCHQGQPCPSCTAAFRAATAAAAKVAAVGRRAEVLVPGPGINISAPASSPNTVRARRRDAPCLRACLLTSLMSTWLHRFCAYQPEYADTYDVNIVFE